MIEESLPGLVVAAFGLNAEELTSLKILRPAIYPMVDCTGDFGLLLTKRPICIVLNPLALHEKQREQLNRHMLGGDGPLYAPIVLVTQDAEGILAFPTLRVGLTARRDRIRSRIIKQLKETDIDPFYAFSCEKSALSNMLNDGFVVLSADMNTYARTHREIIRISAVRVAGFACTDHFETLVRTHLPISPAVRKDTGITDEKLADAPSPLKALQMLDGWYGLDATLVAYNWDFLAPQLSAVWEQDGYDFGRGRVKLDLRKLLLRMFPAYFSQNHIDVDSAADLIPWGIDPRSPHHEKLAELLIFALRCLRRDSEIRSVADILLLYQDNDLSRFNLKFLRGGCEDEKKDGQQ